MMARTGMWPCLAASWVVGAAAAQEPGSRERTVQLTVTSAGDDSVYLDHGRDVGLQVGSLVTLSAPGAPNLEVEVRSVSHTSSRAVVPSGVPLPPVGTRGEARVVPPEPAGAAAPAPAPVRAVPEHPPWTRQEDPRAPGQPLLVPTFGQRPDERPATLDGRWFASGQWSQDRGGDRNSEYLLLRTGLRADATNYLGTGERIRVAGEFDHRSVMLPDAPDESDQDVRLDLLSVAFATEAWAATGVEVGRFYSQALPELGLVDGVEVVQRFEGGFRLGGGLGAYPVPFPARETGEDTGVHVFVDYVADAARTFAYSLGVQKTWHKGSADRDLVLVRGEWRPADRMWLLASAKVDFYTGDDTIKGRGAELTELLAQARWDANDVGAGLLVSHFTWPELKRDEYQNLPDALVRDGYVDRLSANGSMRPASWLSLRVRGDLWRDQDRDGTAYGVDADVRSVIGDGSALSLPYFETDGGYSAGPGARAALRGRLGDGSWHAGYRWHRYELDGLVTGPEKFVRQSVDVGVSWPISVSGDFDFTCERWFGDGENAIALGFYLQWRF
ncbi:MAG TPA: hypothetical protein VFZ65_16725 [Planctomycetota bacterium]|nr:hypothetical protein [Planctomycetota bacterium]